MKHALRKYLAPCGSALFMVVSTMAALVVLVTAMYMAVISTGRVQFATFSQEQAYVSSTSIADVLKYYISDGSNASSPFVKKVLGLKQGQSISTKGNDFASLTGTGTKEDTDLGGYTVDVTRLNDETISGTKWYIYDLAVTVSQNGIVETTHTYIRTKDSEPPPPNNIDRFFTATGYVPNDVVVGDGDYTSTMYFDSEYTMFTDVHGGSNSDLTIKSGIICAGSAVFNKGKSVVSCNDTTEWYFGNNLTLKGNQPDKIDLKGTNAECANPKDKNHGMIVVGGDFEMNATSGLQIGSSGNYTDLYVMGDCYMGSLTIYGDLYVEGDLIFINSNWNSMGKDGLGKFYVNGNITALDGVVPHLNSKNWQGHTKDDAGAQDTFNEAKKYGTWNAIEDNEYHYTVDEIKNLLNAKIGGSVYPKWTVDTSHFEYDINNKPKKTNIYFKNDTGTAEDNYVYLIDKDCKIGTISSDGNQVSSLTIIIDTGGEDDVRTIQLTNNDGDQFSWNPSTIEHGYVNVLTIGKGTLVVDVPDGVRYQATDQEFFGHMGWFFLLGGKFAQKNGLDYFDRSSLEMTNKDTIDPILNKVLHETYFSTGKNSCTSCTYEETTNDEGKKVFKCTNPDHTAEYQTKPTECKCEGYVDKSSVHSYASSKGISLIYKDEEQMPNVNIFVESCSESADIQLGMTTSGGNVKNDLLFGYVYAPYMTYVDIGDGGGVRMVGGLIVSDYVISGYYQYVYCRPDKSITEIVGSNWEPLAPTGSRVWRTYGV